MRFNSKELVWLAQQPAERFDKYGFLQLKEKQEGLFRKGEGEQPGTHFTEDLSIFIHPSLRTS